MYVQSRNQWYYYYQDQNVGKSIGVIKKKHILTLFNSLHIKIILIITVKY